MPENIKQQRLQLEALERVRIYMSSTSSNVEALPPEISGVLRLLVDAQTNLLEAAHVWATSSWHRRLSIVTPEQMWERAIEQVDRALAELKRSQERLPKDQGREAA